MTNIIEEAWLLLDELKVKMNNSSTTVIPLQNNTFSDLKGKCTEYLHEKHPKDLSDIC